MSSQQRGKLGLLLRTRQEETPHGVQRATIGARPKNESVSKRGERAERIPVVVTNPAQPLLLDSTVVRQEIKRQEKPPGGQCQGDQSDQNQDRAGNFQLDQDARGQDPQDGKGCAERLPQGPGSPGDRFALRFRKYGRFRRCGHPLSVFPGAEKIQPFSPQGSSKRGWSLVSALCLYLAVE